MAPPGYEEGVRGGVPTVADVDRIAALADPVVRNLQITQCYHELSLALAAMSEVTANWCTFATWASKQAGQTIREEDLARAFKNLLGRSPAASEAAGVVVASVLRIDSRRDASGVRESAAQALIPRVAFERASDAVGRGNKKVFEEIGREFARFLATVQEDSDFDPEKIARFCAGLRPGEPPEGQRYLKQAFTRYYQALYEDGLKAKAELMLLGSLEIGFHEQTRLQPEILEALNAPVAGPKQFKRSLLMALFPGPGSLLRLALAWLLRRTYPLNDACGRLADHARELTHLVITELMMTLSLPGELLKLGRDLRAEFPEVLERIGNADLRSLLDEMDPTPETVRGSGAEDWSDLRDRMHFIADLFRCYQERQHLFDAPFTAEQVRILKAGSRPPSQL